eukprot:gene43908-54560_t
MKHKNEQRDALIASLQTKLSDRSSSMTKGAKDDHDALNLYKQMLHTLVEKLLILLPQTANQVKPQYNIADLKPSDANNLLIGLLDSIIGYYKDDNYIHGGMSSSSSTASRSITVNSTGGGGNDAELLRRIAQLAATL